MVQKYKTKNTRQHKRLKASYLLKYSVPAAGPEFRLANLKDLSAGGMKFCTHEFLPDGTFLKLNLLVPTHPKPLEVTASVIRLQRASRQKIYSVVVQFLEISRENQQLLNEFIEALAGDKIARRNIDHAPWAMRKETPELLTV